MSRRVSTLLWRFLPRLLVSGEIPPSLSGPFSSCPQLRRCAAPLIFSYSATSERIIRQIGVFGGGVKKSNCDEKERILFLLHVADHTINRQSAHIRIYCWGLKKRVTHIFRCGLKEVLISPSDIDTRALRFPASFLSVFLWASVSFFPFLWNGVCVDPLHGEVADGSMGSRKSAPVLVSSAPRSSDNWIIILPVCPLFCALVSLFFISSFF